MRDLELRFVPGARATRDTENDQHDDQQQK
jgi:hypothetical protein